MLKGLTHHGVRAKVQTAARKAGGSFNSHTFNEVFVGGRWRRLNYSTLGQGILDRNDLGLMTHVYTFGDLAEAGLTETWGRRCALGERDDVYRHANPYRTLAVSDQFGEPADAPNPEVAAPSGSLAETFSSRRLRPRRGGRPRVVPRSPPVEAAPTPRRSR